MIDRVWALKFANDWLESWIAHDLNRILSHYADDIEMTSLLISQRLGRPAGMLKGKAAVREYWRPSLSLAPLCGVS